MKYLLLEHWTDLSEVYPRISIFDTAEARDKETLFQIFGEGIEGHEEEAEKYLAKLRETGNLEFEGDAGLSWQECHELKIETEFEITAEELAQSNRDYAEAANPHFQN